MNTIPNANRNLRAITIPYREKGDRERKEIGVHHIVGWNVFNNQAPIPIIPLHESSGFRDVVDITTREGIDTIFNLCVACYLKCTPLEGRAGTKGKRFTPTSEYAGENDND